MFFFSQHFCFNVDNTLLFVHDIFFSILFNGEQGLEMHEHCVQLVNEHCGHYVQLDDVHMGKLKNTRIHLLSYGYLNPINFLKF